MPIKASFISQVRFNRRRCRELVDVIARERVFNLRLLRMRLDVVDEAKNERSEKEVHQKTNTQHKPKIKAPQIIK